MRDKTQRGLIAAAILAALTAAEFWVALQLTTALFLILAVLALAKAWIILDYFMHITDLWTGED